MAKVTLSTSAQTPTTLQPASMANPRLRNIIIIGLAVAALIAIFFLLFNHPSKAPKILLYTGAQVTKSDEGSNDITLETSVDEVSIKQIVDFYDRELTKNGWTKLNVGTQTEIEYAGAYESADLEWGLSIHINAFPERGFSYVDLYEQRLGSQ